MSVVEHFEILIVGGGKAGKTLAADLGRAGHRVALVERGMVGGTCINIGCIPSKALVRSARVADLVRRAGDFGIRLEHSSTDMAAVLEYKKAVVAGMVALNWDNLHGSLGDNFILGEARICCPADHWRCGRRTEDPSDVSRATNFSLTSGPSRPCPGWRVLTTCDL